MLEHPFSHTTNPDHVHRLAAYWAEVLGGPPGYSAVADQRSLLRIHANTGAEDELGARFLDCFLRALDDAGIPDDPELRAALHDYMAWAVDAFMAYAPNGSRAADAVVPRWSWDGLQAPDPRGDAARPDRRCCTGLALGCECDIAPGRPRLASSGDVIRPWDRHRDHLQRGGDPS